MDYLFLTTDGPETRSELVVEDFNAANEQNDYEVRQTGSALSTVEIRTDQTSVIDPMVAS